MVTPVDLEAWLGRVGRTVVGVGVGVISAAANGSVRAFFIHPHQADSSTSSDDGTWIGPVTGLSREMPDVNHDLALIAQRSDLLRLGVDDKAIGRAKLSGALTPIRRGAYLRRSEDTTVGARDQHGLLTAATIPRLGDGAVVSHVSAAVLHGIAVWPSPNARVHVTKSRPGGGRRTKTLYLHVAALADQDVVAVAGIDVTSVARTVVDVARTESFTTGVVVADHALAQRLVSAEELSAVLAQHRRRVGSQRAAAVLAFADARSESVGESRSRVALFRAGLPTPELQYEVCDADGHFLGRPDFAYVDRKVAGEFDGRQKYVARSVGGRSVTDVVIAERRRSESLVRAGWAVVRWMWEDLETPTVIASKFRAAFDAQARLARPR